MRALKDPKLRAKTVLPFALVLLTLGIAAAGGVLLWGVIGLAILLGIYLIFWTFDIDEAIIDSRPLRLHRYPAGLGRFRVRAVLGRARRASGSSRGTTPMPRTSRAPP